MSIIVEYETEDGRENEFASLIKDHARRTLFEEPGCLRFEVLKPVDSDGRPIPNLMMVSELYADQTAVDNGDRAAVAVGVGVGDGEIAGRFKARSRAGDQQIHGRAVQTDARVIADDRRPCGDGAAARHGDRPEARVERIGDRPFGPGPRDGDRGDAAGNLSANER